MAAESVCTRTSSHFRGGASDLAELLRPRTLSEAVAIAAGGGATLAAGCTDLFPSTHAQVLAGRVVDLTTVAELRGVGATATGWRIGAAATWTDVIRADLPAAFDGLKEAAARVGGVQIQNAGTVAGNICNASPAADGVPPLLTLDAVVELAGPSGARLLALSDFITGPRRTALGPGEVVAAIHVPKTAGRGQSAFLKLGARAHLVISIAMVAVRLHLRDGRIGGIALAVGSCGPVAARLAAQEAALIGQPAADAPDRIAAGLVEPALSPIGDMRADAAYRAGAAVTLLRRAVADCIGRAGAR